MKNKKIVVEAKEIAVSQVIQRHSEAVTGRRWPEQISQLFWHWAMINVWWCAINPATKNPCPMLTGGLNGRCYVYRSDHSFIHPFWMVILILFQDKNVQMQSHFAVRRSRGAWGHGFNSPANPINSWSGKVWHNTEFLACTATGWSQDVFFSLRFESIKKTEKVSQSRTCLFSILSPSQFRS